MRFTAVISQKPYQNSFINKYDRIPKFNIVILSAEFVNENKIGMLP